ncbi:MULTISPECIES: aldehyde dehydrogenase family protein [Leptospira]|uniref:Aldehyde dehydrogenase n=2 Tax=Leptospira borgpetersenii TaxID=174 RepID=A0AAV3JAN7_LEPBO|nr:MULTISPECIES: aldehyde dehydrogenase family protein [Leptospira]AXX14612.1 aldehyde dehydrogenase family protein [Leptospira borgpetersenii serovar Ceylonica]EKQ92230.1 putative aldehyde dehydrogenase [Leptospira borgpetersenii str. UI 09149]EMK10278.1 putative aldehyde dehydrogenase [Leptospira sp. serovar Kenya str. Sh9]EMN13567.1 putative aldehyde dehydrogenase [Leptospira borgpetersenii str. Brem 307]EMN18638.1 putative aldehyde dehydrogenase [Leptospira borgpetersenii str. Brem 328]
MPTIQESPVKSPYSNLTPTLPTVDKTEIERVFHLQKKHFHKVMKLTTASQRIQRLKKLKEAIFKYTPEIEKAVNADFRKNEREVDITEIMPSISEINDAIKHVRRWMKPVKAKTPVTLFGAKSQILYEPRGVVLIIGPWNYPFYLTFAPLAAAIAAGNTVLIKPSEFTPVTSNLIQKIITEVFPKEEVAVFEGDYQVSGALMELPLDHIFFTGSTQVGKIVMTAAAKHLTSVTLELGGKSPAIIDKSADIKKAAKKIVWGKVLNAGQTCVAPDYLLIPDDLIKPFVEEAKSVIKEFYGKDGKALKENPDFCRIVNDRNFNRVSGYIHEAVEKGAKIEMGGETDASQNYIEPTLLSNVPENSNIMEDEIFGPVLPMIPYTNLDEAIKKINSKPKPLALYIFGKKERPIKKILKETSSGGVAVNDVILHLVNPHLPFGGVNHSGHGSYHGYFGFKAFSHERSVLRQAALSSIGLMYPPYTNFVKRLVTLTKKFLV